jgi:hypothetical protein
MSTAYVITILYPGTMLYVAVCLVRRIYERSLETSYHGNHFRVLAEAPAYGVVVDS